MAQFKDSIVSGNLRVTDEILTNLLQTGILRIPTSSGGTTYGLGTSGQIIKSNGSSVYWADDNNTNYYHSTGSWSGLTYTATANGGAPALAFTLPTGTTSTTVAVGNHTHTTTIAAGASSDTNQLTLAFGTKYKLTAGGTNFIFTMPNNPNTDRYVNSASFAHDSTNNNVKMTLTRAGSDTNTVTANIPKVSSSTAGVAPKGAAVSSQSQSTKFLREDGSWAAPSYTTNTNTWRNIKVNGTEKLGTGTGTGALDFVNGTNTTVSYTATGKIAINATNTDTKVTQKNSSTNSYRSLLFGCSTIDNENPYDTADITDYVYRSANLYARTSDGALYCTSDINIQSSNLDRDVTPSEEQIGARFSLRDKDNARCAALYAVNATDNAKALVMSAYNNDGTKSNSFRLAVNNDGTCSYYVTSPSAFRKALDYAAYFDGTTTSGRVVVTSGTGGKVQASSYTIEKSVPSNAVFTDTDTKVTSVSNHYAPAEDSNANLTASASGSTAAWSIDVVKGITLKRDAKGHVVGISVTSGKIPANPNTDEKVKTNLIAPEGDEFPIYYLTATGSTTESAKQLYMNDNAIIRIQTGTASTLGRARLVLGNNTAEGTAGNCCGQLLLYSTDNGYSVLRQATGVSSTGITIYLPPKAGTIFNTGSLVAGDNITLTESNGVYSINGTANTDTKVTVTETDPTTKTTYYPVWRGAHTTGTGGVLVNEDFKYNSQLGTASEVGQATIILGNSTNSGTAGNKSGQIILFAEKSGYTVLKYKASSTSDTTQTFPDTTGTVLNTGTTSISRSLTSGTKIATLTINGTATDLYCQTNTDTHRPIKLKGNAYLGNSSTAVDFLQGSNITLSGGTGDNIGKITIAATNNKTSQTEWADAGGTTRPLLVANGWTDSTAGVYYTNDIYCSSTGVLHCTSCNEHSDKRFKDNIEILDNRYLELIKKLQPKRYKFKNDIENKYHIGFITQEIETELSKCNLTKEDFGTLTETGEDKMQGLAYTDFIPMLLLYIKDLERQIKEIKEQQ